MSLPGQVVVEDELKSNGKSLLSDNGTLTTRTSGYTSGIMQDSDADSFQRGRNIVRENHEENERSLSDHSSSGTDNK